MRRIFFIVGTGRCGSNLCKIMLNLHPGIKVVTETHFIWTLIRLFGKDEMTFGEFFHVADEHYTSDGSKKWTHFHVEAGGRNPITFRSDFETFCDPVNRGTVSEFVEAFFQFCYGRGSYLLGDKTPIYGMHMSAFLGLWPDAKFIHVVRDGRYTATSMQKHLGFVGLINAGFPDKVAEYSYKGVQKSYSTEPVSLVECVRYWERIVTAIRKESREILPRAYREVRYEDLVLHPRRELRKIAVFLDVPVEPTWLGRACVIPNPLSVWRQTKRLTPTNYRMLTVEVGPTLEAFGYSNKSRETERLFKIRNVIQGVINQIVCRLALARLNRTA